jgi:hypothetical protein
MGIKHTIPSGFPASGTTAGRVDATDYRADHNHVPFEVCLFLSAGNTAVAGVASAAANAEMWSTSKTTRNKIDLLYATQFRLVAMVTALGSATTAGIKMQYMTTNAATWAGTDMGATVNSLVVGTGTAGTMFDLGWQNLAAGAIANDLYIALAVSVAFGTTAPSFGCASVFFK